MQLLSAKIEETEYHNLFRKPYHRKFGIISTNDCVKPCRLKRSLFHLQKTWRKREAIINGIPEQGVSYRSQIDSDTKLI